MRALIVEDEAHAAAELARLLAELAPELQVEAPRGSILAAVARLAAPPAPDLIFMDVQLSDGLCFEIFAGLPPTAPVIFTTAYDQFALQAFEAFGIDYLLKPIRPARLAAALDKWRRLRESGGPAAAPPAALAQHLAGAGRALRTRFLVNAGASLVSVPIEDVAYFHKALVVRLVTRSGRAYPLTQSLDELEQTLDPACFFRLNRQVIARAEAISRIDRGLKGRLDITLRPALGEDCSTSPERAAALRAWLDR